MIYKKIVIKIGTNVITRDSGLLNTHVMRQLVEQVATLKAKGVDIVMVSSGAMGAGRGLLELSEKLNDITQRQTLAAVGQIKLMQTYLDLFAKHKLVCAQVLATKEDFRSRNHYLNMRNCFESLMKQGVVPIINENDVVSVDELMFTDNDELASLVASMLNVDALILMTTVDGLMKQVPNQLPEVISEVKSLKAVKSHITQEKSSFGRGGMVTKCHLADKLSKLGITTHIVNGQTERILIDVLKGVSVGTSFHRRSKKASPMKQWIAHAEGQERGVVTVNDCAEVILRDKEKTASLLPVGIIKIKGFFKKGHIVRICGEKGGNIGYGITRYDARKAREFMGRQGKKALIHYDYLYIKDES